MGASTAELRNIIDCIRRIAGVDKFGLVKVDICTVTNVLEAETDRRIDCKSIFSETDVVYKNVMLSAEANDGFILIPDLNSTVIILQIVKSNACYVLQCSDISKMICVIDKDNMIEFDKTSFSFNKGLLGGMVIIADLKKQFDAAQEATKAAVSQALATIDTQLGTLGQAGGSAAAFEGSAQQILPLDLTTLEDQKVKH